MRLICMSFALCPLLAAGQVWEKSLSPGIVYRMEVDTSTPLVVNAIRFARDAGVPRAVPGLSQGTVFGADDDKKGRDVLTKTIEREGALAGINGDFFPWTGDPLGTMVSAGDLLSRPFPGRSVFAWGKNYSTVSRLKWSATASYEGQQGIKIDGLNESCGKDMTVLNTGYAGYALSEAKSFHAILEFPNTLSPSGTWKAKVIATVKDETRVPVGKDQVVLTATGKAMEKFQFLAKGEIVELKMDTSGVDWTKADNVIGGGPVIVSAGKAIQAWDAEDFNGEFANKRHPRSAVGSTKEGDIWFVQVEGRQALSAGVTIQELANIMVKLGCQEALNLDGGGSSEIALTGMVVNRPSDGAERPIANAVLFFGDIQAPNKDEDFVIQGRAKLQQGAATDYKVIDSQGRALPNSKVIWAASGQGWIDQGGRLRGLQAGKSTIRAWYEGRVVTLDVTIEAPPSNPGGR